MVRVYVEFCRILASLQLGHSVDTETITSNFKAVISYVLNADSGR